ncbi:family 16 glycoside hydrolase [Pantoea agglomerans]|uniref:family 16 glycoside hydrolase n=1 Tax=Enterobacter agglomerans TaxID=549 RepID=UPI002B1DA098|nr:family 16 glycoside hydrolase [Pantoea agglomerans]
MLKKSGLLMVGCMMVFSSDASTALTLPAKDFNLIGVTLEEGNFKGSKASRISMPSGQWQDPDKETLTDRNYMAWLPINFHSGIIEVDLASTLATGAPDYARGFAGVSFRIQSDGSFENIYLRPTNSQSQDQVRRNHSVQYFAYPNFRFDRLRKEAPERYETYADIKPDEWIHIKIVVTGHHATLYLNNNPTPAFMVNDLKLGSSAKGGVGIWIESGTVAWFRNLKVTAESE